MSGDRKQLEPSEGLASQHARSADRPAEAAVPSRLSERQYCVFRVGKERFCLSMLEVEEVVEWPVVTRVPLSPAFLMGIFNLRGTIVPVIDIALTEGRRPDLLPRHVVVAALQPDAGKDAVRLGIAADELVGTFASSEPLELDQMPQGMNHCCGMLRHEASRLALVLDVKRVLETFSVGVV